MAIKMNDYIKGLFDLEIVTEVWIFEKKAKEGEPYPTEYVVSSKDLFDGKTIPPVQDKHFTNTSPCIAFCGLECFKSEFLKDTNNELPPDSPYQGYRWHIIK